MTGAISDPPATDRDGKVASISVSPNRWPIGGK
jgi:hypothetical protein